MDNQKMAKLKKQRNTLRNRIKEDINKLAQMGNISNFQATHMILDKLINEVDTYAKEGYSPLKADQWIGGLAETYLPSTTEIVHGLGDTFAPETTEANGTFHSYTYAGIGPLTKGQYDACMNTYNLTGGAHALSQAGHYAEANKQVKKYIPQPWDWGTTEPIQGQSADLLIVDDPALTITTQVPGKSNDWNYTLYASSGTSTKGIKIAECISSYTVDLYGLIIGPNESHLVEMVYHADKDAYQLTPKGGFKVPKPKGKLTMKSADEIIGNYYNDGGWGAHEKHVQAHKDAKAAYMAKYAYGKVPVSKAIKEVHEATYGKANKGAFTQAVEKELLEAEAAILNQVEQKVLGGPKSKFAIVGKGGSMYTLTVGNWYTGNFISNITGHAPKKLKVPTGYVVIAHPSKDIIKVVPEVLPNGNKAVFDDF